MAIFKFKGLELLIAKREKSENTELPKTIQGSNMKILTASLLAILLVLSGCATRNVKTDITTNELQTKKSALLVMSLSQPKESVQYGATTIYFLPKGTDSIARSRLVTYDPDYVLPKPDSDFPNEFSLLKVIEVPEGEVQISGWAFAMYRSRYESTDASPPFTIKVKAGDIVYLGNFSLTPHYGDGIFGVTTVRGATPLIKDQSQRDLSLFKQRYPQLPPAIHQQLPVGIWALEPYQKLLKKLLELEKNNPSNPKAED